MGHTVYVYSKNASNKKEKNSIFYGSLPIERVHDKYCISDKSQDTAGFVTDLCRPLPG